MKAFIITLETDSSLQLANRCLSTCKENDIDAYIWQAFDGTKSGIVTPKQLLGQAHISLLQVKNFKLTLPEIACFYSHYSLWCHCILMNEPIIILEHDAIILKPYEKHKYKNSISYLGHEDQLTDTPNGYDVSIEGYDFTFIRGAYAYSIDPYCAKNLVAHTIKEGICRPVDVTMRSDYFSINQDDVFAIHKNNISTMPDRQLFSEVTS